MKPPEPHAKSPEGHQTDRVAHNKSPEAQAKSPEGHQTDMVAHREKAEGHQMSPVAHQNWTEGFLFYQNLLLKQTIDHLCSQKTNQINLKVHHG